MKQLLLLLLIPTLLFAFSGLGTGTSGDPFQITTVTQLQEMKDNLSAHYRLKNEIDASETAGWNSGEGFEPIGDSDDKFTGTLSGGGYIIDSLTINRPTEDRVGLFGNVEGASIDSVTLTSANIVGDNKIGILVGFITSTTSITNCSTTGSIDGKDYLGGVVGFASESSYLSHLTSSAKVTGVDDYIGGVVGRMIGGLIIYSFSTGSASGDAAVGGVVGRISSTATVEACWSTAVVQANTQGGGIVGRNSSGIINACYSSATITSDSLCAGGVVGKNANGIISNCYFDGSVTSSQIIGGIVGTLENSRGSVLQSCYSVGSVTGTDSVGGIVGWFADEAAASDCYWDSTGAVISSFGSRDDNGEALSTEQIQSRSPYENWNGTIWYRNATEAPILYWQDGFIIDTSKGFGTESSPYLISTVLDLQSMQVDPTAHYRIIQDIDASATSSWNDNIGFVPVGTDEYPFPENRMVVGTQ